MSIFNSFNISASGMTAERYRMDIMAENLANAHTTRTEDGTPYRRKVVTFEERPQGAQTYSLGRRSFIASTTTYMQATPITPSVTGSPGSATPQRSRIYSTRPAPANQKRRFRATSMRREYTAVMPIITSIIMIMTTNWPVGTPMMVPSTYFMPTTNTTTASSAANSTNPLMPSRYSTKKSAMKVSADPVSFCSRISTIGMKIRASAFT